MQSTDFEKVREIVVKSERDAELNAGVAVVVETEFVVNAATQKKQRAHDMNGVFGQRKLPAEIHIRIGQVDEVANYRRAYLSRATKADTIKQKLKSARDTGYRHEKTPSLCSP